MPALTHVAIPVAAIVATDVVADAQVTDEVMSFVVLSEYVPVAVNCVVVVVLIDGLAGVTAIDESVGALPPEPPQAEKIITVSNMPKPQIILDLYIGKPPLIFTKTEYPLYLIFTLYQQLFVMGA